MSEQLDQTEAADGQSHLTGVLGADLEWELRAAINPLYEDVRGTESYERKRLLGEIDRLRKLLNQVLTDAHAQDVLLEWWHALECESVAAPNGQS